MSDLRSAAAAAGGADLRAEAEQGLQVWAPLANRLGVWSLKAELEDLCFLVRPAFRGSVLDICRCLHVGTFFGDLLARASRA